MFESEGDKKKKVYPHLPDVWASEDTHYRGIMLENSYCLTIF